MVSLEQSGITVRLAPLVVYATLKEVHALRRFPLIVYTGNQMELRLLLVEGVTREAAFTQAAEKLKELLAAQGVYDYTCTLSGEEPKANPQNGKFKHIIQERSPEEGSVKSSREIPDPVPN